MRVIIFANGELQHPQSVLEIIQDGDVLIAADGGARHCLSLGLFPKLVIGDFDSLSEAELRELEEAGAEILRHPTDKDETDLELALLKAREYKPKEIIILGALGARWDMTLANLLLLAHRELGSQKIRIIDGYQELSLLRNGESMEIHGHAGDTVSLIPILGDARGISTQGLVYPLKNGTLHVGASRGVSNVMKNQYARVELEEGLLLVVLIKDH
ncbi:MAG: thiamine diphosphokinase [Chloroflexi bacterium]|nr:thiamine diphosphokinase [Chloroflexota bacterium]